MPRILLNCDFLAGAEGSALSICNGVYCALPKLMKAVGNSNFDELLTTVVEFISGLVAEGERALVIGGAARLELALEHLLKAITITSPKDPGDELFGPDRPLGSFSAKIDLAYRLGLSDGDAKKGLHLVRKIRNDFAHASVHVRLTESKYQDRLNEITNCVRHCSLFECMEEDLQVRGPAIVSSNSVPCCFPTTANFYH